MREVQEKFKDRHSLILSADNIFNKFQLLPSNYSIHSMQAVVNGTRKLDGYYHRYVYHRTCLE